MAHSFALTKPENKKPTTFLIILQILSSCLKNCLYLSRRHKSTEVFGGRSRPGVEALKKFFWCYISSPCKSLP